MKKIFITIFITSLLFIIGCGSQSESPTSSTLASTSKEQEIAVTCDVTRFEHVSGAELISLLGEPDNIDETTAPNAIVEVPCMYYEYYEHPELGSVSFTLVNDQVVKFVAYNDFPFYKDTEKLLKSLNVVKSENCAIAVNTDTALRYRCLTDGIDDLHITLIEEEIYGFLAVTYDMFYYEEWYLPMSITEQSNYQYWTQETVKSLLKSPKSADFPNINNWAIVKNQFYVAAQSYVDAVNSFGAEIRSEFTFIYYAGTDSLVYAVFDGEVIHDAGYVDTKKLINQLVDSMHDSSSDNVAEETPTPNPTEEPMQATEPTPTSAPVATEAPTSTVTVAPTATSTPKPTNTPKPTVTPEPTKIVNDYTKVEKAAEKSCAELSSGKMKYPGALHANIISATEIELEYVVDQKVPEDKEQELLEECNSLLDKFVDAFTGDFPEEIEVYVSVYYDTFPEWCSITELRELSGNKELNFDVYTYSLDAYFSGVGKIVYCFYEEGIISQAFKYFYDIPDSFADADNDSGVFDNVHMKKENGNWLFKVDDLVALGLLNSDYSFNESFKREDYSQELAKKPWEKEWISADELSNIYDFSTTWMGEYILLNKYDENWNQIKYKITGSPKSKFEKDVIYEGDCEGLLIRFEYDSEYNGICFIYQDLVAAGIVEQ